MVFYTERYSAATILYNVLQSSFECNNKICVFVNVFVTAK